MSWPVIDLSRRETAAEERGRLTELLTSIEATRAARTDWDARDVDLLTEQDWTVLDQLQELEGGLLKLALDPALAAFLTCLVEQLDMIAEGRP